MLDLSYILCPKYMGCPRGRSKSRGNIPTLSRLVWLFDTIYLNTLCVWFIWCTMYILWKWLQIPKKNTFRHHYRYPTHTHITDHLGKMTPEVVTIQLSFHIIKQAKKVKTSVRASLLKTAACPYIPFHSQHECWRNNWPLFISYWIIIPVCPSFSEPENVDYLISMSIALSFCWK